jgi:hypothetical protein
VLESFVVTSTISPFTVIDVALNPPIVAGVPVELSFSKKLLPFCAAILFSPFNFNYQKRLL